MLGTLMTEFARSPHFYRPLKLFFVMARSLASISNLASVSCGARGDFPYIAAVIPIAAADRFQLLGARLLATPSLLLCLCPNVSKKLPFVPTSLENSTMLRFLKGNYKVMPWNTEVNLLTYDFGAQG